jgi:hypothetical protein
LWRRPRPKLGCGAKERRKKKKKKKMMMMMKSVMSLRKLNSVASDRFRVVSMFVWEYPKIVA